MYKANRINFKGPISTMTENRNVASDTTQRPELLGLIQPKNRCVIAKPK
eukprot:gene13086-8932_t